jgi:hypothetical protein
LKFLDGRTDILDIDLNARLRQRRTFDFQNCAVPALNAQAQLDAGVAGSPNGVLPPILSIVGG